MAVRCSQFEATLNSEPEPETLLVTAEAFARHKKAGASKLYYETGCAALVINIALPKREPALGDKV